MGCIPNLFNGLLKRIGPLLVIVSFGKNRDISAYKPSFSVTNLMWQMRGTVDNLGVAWTDVRTDKLNAKYGSFRLVNIEDKDHELLYPEAAEALKASCYGLLEDKAFSLAEIQAILK